MFIVVVRAEVKPEKVDAFIELATFNAGASRKEPGNRRFDVMRSVDDPRVFRLYEVYADEAGFKAHQATAHYARWKAEVGDLLANPRISEKFTSLSPEPWQ